MSRVLKTIKTIKLSTQAMSTANAAKAANLHSGSCATHQFFSRNSVRFYRLMRLESLKGKEKKPKEAITNIINSDQPEKIHQNLYNDDDRDNKKLFFKIKTIGDKEEEEDGDIEENQVKVKFSKETKKIQILKKSMQKRLTNKTDNKTTVKDTENGSKVSLNNEKKIVERPPIICVLGHVDHGKTTLIDYLRNSKVAENEAGNITQAIGAFSVKTKNDKSLTIIDTPGHEAFSGMRKRGAILVDCAILVVSSEDGVMPTTRESIKLLRDSNTSFIVAVTKMDSTRKDMNNVFKSLALCDIYSDSIGGSDTVMKVSAKTGEGIDDLIEMVYLESSISEPKADLLAPPTARIIEKNKEKTGVVLNCIVTNGILNVNDYFLVGHTMGKIRSMTTETGESLKSALPSQPVSLKGLRDIDPDCDAQDLEVFGCQTEARREQIVREKVFERPTGEIVYSKLEYSLRRRLMYSEWRKVKGQHTIGFKKFKRLHKYKKALERIEIEKQLNLEKKNIKLLFKADCTGSAETLEKIFSNLEIPNNEVELKTVNYKVGHITIGDVKTAHSTEALILGFAVEMNSDAAAEAKKLNVEVHIFDVVYDMQDFVAMRLNKILTPVYMLEPIGLADVKQIFRHEKKKNKLEAVLGCFVRSGVIECSRFTVFRVLRDEEVIYESDGPIATIKNFKEIVEKVEEKNECGLALNGVEDLREGDQIEVLRKVLVYPKVNFKVGCRASDEKNTPVPEV